MMMPLWLDLYEEDETEDWLKWAFEQEADEPETYFQFDPDLLDMSDLEDDSL